ncbi:amino acid deaminase [Diaphorobacter sp.]|uniref:amino acid deaminase n=1 Tax=Diaphorobacter sp. TaxID=1934310 RepID=UPI0028AE4E81|nr:amino acid deaminase [Diaphorobacter sp.]
MTAPMTDSITAPTFVLGPDFKGFPPAAPACALADIGGQGWNVLGDDLPFPLAVLKRSALEHNVAWMQDFAQRKGILLAPHGKTTMSPELFAAQMVAGAWGLTFATVFQARVGVAAGARRIIIANQVVCDADLDGLDALLTQTEGLRVWFLVDSLAQVTLIEDWVRRRASTRVFDVLLEMGIPGKRTGCRTLEQALEVAQAVARSASLQLGGVECYEGNAANCDSEHDAREVTALVRRVMDLALACDSLRLWAAQEDHILISAGGSAVFDLVVPLLRMQGLALPLRGVLRSGCYVTHDHLNYRRYLRNVEMREGLDASLRPALTVWAMVQSVPEPGLALLTCGRRDISSDIDLPTPVRVARKGLRTADEVPAGWSIEALNDQHAYLHFDAAGAAGPQVGDRVELGISHPCTTFDKWRWMPLVEDDGRVCGAIHTCF